MSDPRTKDLVDPRRRDEVLLFLGKETEKLRAGGTATYDLVSEYRKTKANRTPIVILSMLAATAIIIGISFFVTRIIDSHSRSVSIDIQSFEDLNLRDLLDVAKRNIDEQDRLSIELTSLESDLQAKVDRVEDQKKASIVLADAMGLSPSDYTKRLKAIEAEVESARRTIRAEHEPLIFAKRQEFAALQEKIAAYDTRSLEQAKKQQENLDNQQNLFELEQKRLASVYEERIASLENALKTEKSDGNRRLSTAISQLTLRYEKELANLTALYNPAWKGDRAAILVSSSTGNSDLQSSVPIKRPDIPRIADDSLKGAPIDSATIREAVARYDDVRLLIGRLREVPYINSVPGALAAMDSASADIAKNYVDLLAAAASSVRSRDARILKLETAVSDSLKRNDSYAYALASYSRGENEVGFIVDARNTNSIIVFMDPLYRITEGTEDSSAWVFRADDQLIAELRLRRIGDSTIGRLEHLEAGQQIQAFDRILLKSANAPEVSP